MKEKDFEPSNLSRSQIEKLAVMFAEKTGFIPCETNIYDYIEKLGGKIEYTFENLDSNGGSIIVNSPKDFIIKLSHATSPKRDIFTIAHELGHFVLHSDFGNKKIRAQRSDDSSLPEKEANSFAASFLMPRDKVEEVYNRLHGNISKLAQEFNVSILAATWRCKNLGLE